MQMETYVKTIVHASEIVIVCQWEMYLDLVKAMQCHPSERLDSGSPDCVGDACKTVTAESAKLQAVSFIQRKASL